MEEITGELVHIPEQSQAIQAKPVQSLALPPKPPEPALPRFDLHIGRKVNVVAGGNVTITGDTKTLTNTDSRRTFSRPHRRSLQPYESPYLLMVFTIVFLGLILGFVSRPPAPPMPPSIEVPHG